MSVIWNVIHLMQVIAFLVLLGLVASRAFEYKCPKCDGKMKLRWTRASGDTYECEDCGYSGEPKKQKVSLVSRIKKAFKRKKK